MSKVNLIYAGTTSASPLRKLMIDLAFETNGLKKEYERRDAVSSQEDLTMEFLWDMLRSSRERKAAIGSAPLGTRASYHTNKMADFCEKYHDHSKPETRPAITDE